MNQSNHATSQQAASPSGGRYRPGGTTPAGSNENDTTHHGHPIEDKAAGCSMSYHILQAVPTAS
jgi:hypothetical protein